MQGSRAVDGAEDVTRAGTVASAVRWQAIGVPSRRRPSTGMYRPSEIVRLGESGEATPHYGDEQRQNRSRSGSNATICSWTSSATRRRCSAWSAVVTVVP